MKTRLRELYEDIYERPGGDCVDGEGRLLSHYLEHKLPDWQYDIAVAYRITDFALKPVAGVSRFESKLDLARHCLATFKAGLGALKAKIYVVMTVRDENKAAYAAMFKELWGLEDLNLVSVGRVGGPKSLWAQVEILATQTNAQMVYVAEDDYEYKQGSIERAVHALQGGGSDFISLYDHPDNETLDLQQIKCAVLEADGVVYKRRAATCHTFLTRRSTLNRVAWVFRKPWLSSIDADTSHWLALTKSNLFRITLNRYWMFCIGFTWLFRWWWVLFARRRSLHVASPGLAVHLGEA